MLKSCSGPGGHELGAFVSTTGGPPCDRAQHKCEVRKLSRVAEAEEEEEESLMG